MTTLPAIDSAQTVDKSTTSLRELVRQTDRALYTCSSVFPFTFFPDTIRVDLHKIDIIYRMFFFSERVFTLMFKDIRTVDVTTGPFFASVYFEVIGYEQNPEPIKFLPRAQALRLRRIIIGLTAIKRENIPLEAENKRSILQKAEDIGESHEE